MPENDADHLTPDDWKLREAALTRRNEVLEARLGERTAELQALQRDMDLFAYSISHDLRAPLRGINGWSGALLEDFGPMFEPQAMIYLQRVLNESQRMERLIDGIHRLYRVLKLDLQSRELDLSGLAQTIAQRMRETWKSPTRRFVIQGGLTWFCDPNLMEIVLTELFDNACKFTGLREAPEVEFGTKSLEGSEVFFVRDNGTGYSVQYADKLFGVFQRMHKETDFPGLGIGLALVQRAIRRMGGQVWAEAEEDRGAWFYFKLPRTAA